MTHVAHFTYGWINPFMGFGFALAGSFLGLNCMVQARRLQSGRERFRWLVFAALAIGGTGIWMMHFIAMIGFSVTGSDVRYDIGVTLLSLVISILSVAFGIFVVGLGRQSLVKVLIGGPLTGLGVVSMHYAGMAAVNVSGALYYHPTWVGASVAIAVVAATVALFFTIWVDTRRSHVFAALTMAVAVCGMHYTGMGAVTVELHNNGGNSVPGVDPLLLLIPILVLATAALIALIVGVLGERDEEPARSRPVARHSAERRRTPAAQPQAERPVPEQQQPASVSPTSSFWTGDEGARPPEPGERRIGVAAAAMANRELPRPGGAPGPQGGSDYPADPRLRRREDANQGR